MKYNVMRPNNNKFIMNMFTNIIFQMQFIVSINEKSKKKIAHKHVGCD